MLIDGRNHVTAQVTFRDRYSPAWPCKYTYEWNGETDIKKTEDTTKDLLSMDLQASLKATKRSRNVFCVPTSCLPRV